MEQMEEQKATKDKVTFRGLVDLAVVFGCAPALVLVVIFWAIATTFPHAGVLPNIMALLITLLLSFMGIVLLIRYIDITAISFAGDDPLVPMGAIGIIVLLVICAVGSLSVAGSLEGYHYTLVTAQVLLVGYQIWRVFNEK